MMKVMMMMMNVHIEGHRHHLHVMIITRKTLAMRFLGLVFFFLIHCTQAQSSSMSSSVELSALLDLRSELGLRSPDWPLKSDPCKTWNGVQCKNGRVTGINISGLKRTHVGRLNPSFSVDSLAKLTFLEVFNASRFYLPGSIPDWFGYRLGSLKVLDLRSSSVAGAIPSSLGNLTRLSALYLSGNELTGNLPSELGQLVELSILDLSRNQISGSVPDSFGMLANLASLDLSSNCLSGSIPPSLGNMSRLKLLNLSDNHVGGTIPVELGNLWQLVELNLTKNSLSGRLPVELKGLRYLERIEIGGNELEGRLWDGLFGGLSRLQVVVLSGNKFDGALPGEFWSMPNLRAFDVSHNNFTGVLPIASKNWNGSGAMFNLSNNLLYGTLSSSLVRCSLIDLSGNYFQGKVPYGTPNNVSLGGNCLQAVLNQRSASDCRLFYDERGLCFDNFGATEPTQPPLPEHDLKRRKRWIYFAIGLCGGVVFIVVLVVLMVVIIKKCDKTIANQKGIAEVGPVPEGDNPTLPKDPTNASSLVESLTYDQLLHSTAEFSEANLIKHGHSGDIFQGTLEGGMPMVVKKINLLLSKKESYLMELEFFSKYSHKRFVPLLGHCLENETEKFLVYKYMPNGDLINALHRETNVEDDGLQTLDWITRLKIAIGVAEGLAYLHHECNPPLVHREVQASSILLDDKFEVRLGSLSEIHVQEGDSHHNVFTRFLRKPHISEAGPSGSTLVTCAYDVYCLGKVLLELITGKLGVSKSDDATTKEWLEHTLAHISLYDKELVMKIVDPSMIVDEDLLEEVWAMAIVASSCLNPKPSKRPPMKYILKALENPLKVVREESFSSGRLRTTSSRRSWSTAFFGSWRHSSSDNITVLGHANREVISGLKLPGGAGSHGSGKIERSSSNKRLSSEIFPLPLEMQDFERQDER